MEEAGRAPVVPWGRNNTLVSFPPAHTERPHFPTSLAISRGYVIEFWPLGCRKKRSVSLLDLAPKIFCTVLNILSFSRDSDGGTIQIKGSWVILRSQGASYVRTWIRNKPSSYQATEIWAVRYRSWIILIFPKMLPDYHLPFQILCYCLRVFRISFLSRVISEIFRSNRKN